MRLSIQEIKDYNYCPRLYKFTNIDKLYTGKTTTIERYYEQCVKQTGYWFFYSIQDGIVPTVREVRRKFGDLFIGDRTIGETLFLSRSIRNIARTLEKKSFNMLNNFYDTYSNDYGVPILINKDYEIKVKDIIVHGTIPVIRENSKKQIEILSFYVDSTKSRKDNLPISAIYDIETTASSIAFKSLFGQRPDLHSYYGFQSGSYREIVKSPTQLKDFNYLVESVGTAIQNELFHPVYNNNCISCIYNKICTRI